MICNPNEENLKMIIQHCDELAKVRPFHGIDPAALAQSEKEFFMKKYADGEYITTDDDIQDFLERFKPKYRAQIEKEINRKLF